MTRKQHNPGIREIGEVRRNEKANPEWQLEKLMNYDTKSVKKSDGKKSVMPIENAVHETRKVSLKESIRKWGDLVFSPDGSVTHSKGLDPSKIISEIASNNTTKESSKMS